MPGLDEETALELVGDIYAAAYKPAGWRHYLERLRTQTGATLACLVAFDFDPGSRSEQFGELVGAPEMFAAYADYYWQVDEFAAANQRAAVRPGQVVDSSRLVADADLAASEFYSGYLRPYDQFYFAGCLLFATRSKLVWSGVMRARSQGPADAGTTRLFERLMPHQQQALRIDQRLRQLEAARSLAGGAIDALPYGLIALDRRGRVLAMNRMAEAIVADSDGLHLGPGGLAGLHPRDDAALRRALAAALARQPAGGTVHLPRPSSPQPLRVIVAPVPRDQPPLMPDNLTPAALLFVHDPTRRAPAPVEILRRLYGLSPQQARLTTLLAEGLSLGEAADRLGIAGETATSHLKQVYRKTGVRRQSELIRLLLSLPADTHGR